MAWFTDIDAENKCFHSNINKLATGKERVPIIDIVTALFRELVIVALAEFQYSWVVTTTRPLRPPHGTSSLLSHIYDSRQSGGWLLTVACTKGIIEHVNMGENSDHWNFNLDKPQKSTVERPWSCHFSDVLANLRQSSDSNLRVLTFLVLNT